MLKDSGQKTQTALPFFMKKTDSGCQKSEQIPFDFSLSHYFAKKKTPKKNKENPRKINLIMRKKINK